MIISSDEEDGGGLSVCVPGGQNQAGKSQKLTPYPLKLSLFSLNKSKTINT